MGVAKTEHAVLIAFAALMRQSSGKTGRAVSPAQRVPGQPWRRDGDSPFFLPSRYVDDMCRRAAAGFAQYQRQDLIGGRYGLCGIPHDGEYLGHDDAVVLQSNFWVQFLWKRLLGIEVMNTTVVSATAKDTDAENLRAYAFAGVPPSPHAPRDVRNALVLINLDAANPAVVSLGAMAPEAYQYTLSPGPEGVFGKATSLNGKVLQAEISDGEAIEEIPVPRVPQYSSEVEIPPLSVMFLINYV